MSGRFDWRLFLFIITIWRCSSFIFDDVIVDDSFFQVDHKPYLSFPAVTICNVNRFMENRIPADMNVNKLFDILGQIPDYEYYEDNDYDDDYELDDNKYQDANISLDNYDDINFKDLYNQSGFNLNASLMRCDWKGKNRSCCARDFTPVFLPYYGKCYTFNHINDRRAFTQNLAGIGNGLKIWINIKQEFYTEPYEGGHQEAGLQFLVHNENDPPMIDVLGMAAPPGFHSYVAVRPSQFIDLPNPYTECVSSCHSGYSRTRCLTICKGEFILQACGCEPHGYQLQSGNRSCSLAETVNCVSEATQKFGSGTGNNCSTSCPYPCNQTTYESSVSMAVFPSENQVHTLSDEAASGSNYIDYDVEDERAAIADNIRKSWIILDIYFDQLTVTSYTQVPSMTWDAMLSDLGGQMGLFLGCSVITIAEILEYLIRKIYRFVTGYRPSNEVVAVINE